MINHALRIRRRRGDIFQDLRLGRGGRDIERGEVAFREGGEDLVDEGSDVGRVLRVREVDG